MTLFRLLRYVFLYPLLLNCQKTLTVTSAGEFLNELIHSSGTVTKWIDTDEITGSTRLGIYYTGIDQKFFIGYGIPDTARNLVQMKKTPYHYTVTPLGDNYSLLTFLVPQLSLKQKFYFHGTKCISAATYYTKGWKEYKGRYLIVRVSDTAAFNLYSLQQLDEFVEHFGKDLHFTNEEMETLAKQKILYVRCKDEKEIEEITGFKTLGMALLNIDAVASQYNCHYHELVHLLINFKLKNLPLYTHPFFQEGFAVAQGGRGGKDPKVLQEMGRFIAASGFETYTTLLDPQTFSQTDASISYALSGLYASFLIHDLGVEEYLKLYRRFSASRFSDIQLIPEKIFPANVRWNMYIDSIKHQRAIRFDRNKQHETILWKNDDQVISESGDAYFFTIKDSVTLFSSDGEKLFTISADEHEIRIVNSRTENLAAGFFTVFSFPPEKIPKGKDAFTFSVDKCIFGKLNLKEVKFGSHY